MAEVEETLKRIQSQKRLPGITVVNSEGISIKSTMDNSTTIQYAGLMHSFIMKARSPVRDIKPQNDLTFLRILISTLGSYILSILLPIPLGPVF
uniref:Roadblock/LAMTOR2 domain-containing protein n=1 Tax=Amazona collaria TaxID=241587 RepID=A0A8B9FNP8_9PSIT